MKQSIFQQLLEKPKSTKKWLFFPLSLLFHGLAVLSLIVTPLLSTAVELPVVKVLTVTLAAPPTPSVPLGPSSGGGGRKFRKETKPKETTPPKVQSGRIFVPVQIPSEIEEEPFENFGFGTGNGPDIIGAPPGNGSGVIGAPYLHGTFEDLNNQEVMRISIVQKPRLIKKVEPIYPRAAILARIKGLVVIEAVTDISGRVVKTNVLSGHPLLKQAAVQAVMQWVYEPYIVNGFPKPVKFMVNVNFTLR